MRAEIRERVIDMKERGYKPKQICQILTETEGHKVVTKSGIYKLLRKYRQIGYVDNRPRPLGLTAKIQQQHKDLIEEVYIEDAEVTAPRVRMIIMERTGLLVSVETVRRVRREIGWEVCVPRQLLWFLR